MNLQELLDKLAPEDRKVILEHFILSLQGKTSDEPIVIRKTAKLSTLSSEEEMKKQLSNIFDIPLEKLDKFNFSENIQSINANYKKVEHFITPFKDYLTSVKSKPDKFEELNDIGKFLVSLEIPCSIVVPEKALPYPDFVIASEHKSIGIEHTRLINIGSQRFIKNITQILKTAEQNLRRKNSNLIQIINLSFNYQIEVVNNKSLSNPTLTKVEKDLIAELISDYVYSHLENPNTTKPGFIDKIEFSMDSVHPLSINLVENYVGKTEIEKLLIKRLDSKEQKYSHYSTIKNFDEIWLVVIVNGITVASSYIIEGDSLKSKIASNFTKVFLFDSFSNKPLLIYDSTIIDT